MKKIIAYITCFFLLLSCSVQAQSEYSIRLKSTGNTLQNGKVSYLVQLSANQPQAFNLAGQNYRIYYDASIISLDKTASESMLPIPRYTPILWNPGFDDIDASSIAALSFDEHLGFVNFGIALEDLIGGGISLPVSGDWTSIATLTFNVKNKEKLTAQQGEIFRWARPSLTLNYATAFVEVAEWINRHKMVPAIAVDYEDSELTTSIDAIDVIKEVSVFPNPFNHHLTIKYESTEIIQLEVWDLLGKRLHKATLPKGRNAISKDFSNYAAGSYQVRLIQAHKVINKLIEKIN